MTYSQEERARARSTVRRLVQLAHEARIASERGVLLPSEAETAILGLTQTNERSNQIEALHIMSERVRNAHLAKLKPMAAGNFNAFCEYVNPDEPPESPWHIFLTDILQRIETEPGNERFVLNVAPGHAKPLSVETRILMGDGALKRLGDIAVGETVISHLGRACIVTHVHEQGELDVLRLKTAGGRTVITAPDHSFLVTQRARFAATTQTQEVSPAFVQVQNLRIGNLCHLPAPSKVRNHSNRISGLCELAAYWHAKGGRTYNFGRRKAFNYRNVFLFAVDEATAQRYCACLDALNLPYHARYDAGAKLHYVRPSTATGDKLSAAFGFDDRAEDRRIPSFVFKGGDAGLRRYIETFVSLCGVAPLRYKLPRIHLSFNSRHLAEDFAQVLARFAVPCRTLKRGRNAARIVLDAGQVEAYFAAGLSFAGGNAARLAEQRRQFPQTAVHTDCVRSIEPWGKAQCRCLTVAQDETFIAEGLAVHNSTYASRLFPAWRMGRRPRDKIIGAGHGQTFVENEFSKKIRSLVGSPPYRDIFPTITIDATTRAANQWALAGSGGQYVAKGAGQGIHGYRANFVCVDDPYAKLDDAESPTIRENIKTWFFNDIGSRLLPGAVVFLIMTRFHEDDLTGSVIAANLKLAEPFRYKIVAVPAICYDPENDFLNRKLGEVLWNYYNLEHFEAFRATWSYQRFSLVFQQLTGASDESSIASKLKFYSALPYADDAAIAKAKAAGAVDPLTLRAVVDKRAYFRRIVASVDCAAKKTERADYTVVQIWGETHERKHYLIAQTRGKFEFPEMISKIEGLSRLHSVDAILVEDKGQGTAYIQARGSNDHQRRLAPAPVVAIQVPSSQGKEFRFDEISPMIEAGEVYVPERADWIDLFVREVGQFPDGSHDDQVDAMTQYLRWVKTKRTRYGSRKIASMG